MILCELVVEGVVVFLFLFDFMDDVAFCFITRFIIYMSVYVSVLGVFVLYVKLL